MRKLSLPSRKKTTFSVVTFFVFLVLCLDSCKKNLSDQAVTITDPAVEKITNWVESQKAGKTAAGIAKIQSVIDAMDLPGLSIEKLSDKERMFIIPLNKSFVAKFNMDSNPVNVLLFIENENGVIRRGNIVQFVPEQGKQVNKLAPNSFYNLYNGMTPVLGKFTFLSMLGIFQYEIENKDGGISSFKISSKKNNSPSSVLTSASSCTEWYYVTTTTYPDGHTEENWEYLYTTCSSCAPWEDCNENGSGGGSSGGGENGEGEPEVVASFTKAENWVVTSATDQAWHVRSYENLYGQKTGTNPSLFTSVIHSSTAIFNGNGSSATWQALNTVVFLKESNAFAVADVSGKITTFSGDYPVHNSKTWYSPIEFP